MADKNPLLRRIEAAELTLAKFNKREFQWGSNDCAMMCAFNLKALGYKIKMPELGSYKSAAGALKKLKVFGFISLSDAMDKLGFERIPPASCLAGDVIQMPSADERLDAMAIYLGNNRVLGFYSGKAGVLIPNTFVAAWRVNPWQK